MRSASSALACATALATSACASAEMISTVARIRSSDGWCCVASRTRKRACVRARVPRLQRCRACKRSFMGRGNAQGAAGGCP